MPNLTPKKIYTLDDISIVPNSRGDQGKNNARVSYTFPYSHHTFEGVPLILGGVWSLEDAFTIAKRGVLTQFNAPVRETKEFWADMLTVDGAKDALDRMVFHAQPGDDLGVLGEGTAKYLRVRTDYPNMRNMREAFPHTTIIAGDFLTKGDAAGMAQWADIVVMGCLDAHELNGWWGVDIDHLDMLVNATHGVVASFCSTVGDVVKCLALGADFVEIGPSLQDHTVEKIIAIIASACEALGASEPYELPYVTYIGAR